jgi:hypothetical protein
MYYDNMKTLFIVAIIAITIFIFGGYREYMTNEKLIAGLTKHSVNTPATATASATAIPLYGPSAVNPPPAPATGGGNGSGSGSDGASYPDIYGPDVPLVPGSKGVGGGSVGNSVAGLDEQQFVYNPNLRKAFPTADGEPKPFLTDLHKIQH